MCRVYVNVHIIHQGFLQAPREPPNYPASLWQVVGSRWVRIATYMAGDIRTGFSLPITHRFVCGRFRMLSHLSAIPSIGSMGALALDPDLGSGPRMVTDFTNGSTFSLRLTDHELAVIRH